MLDVADLRAAFAEKLTKTGSLDAAFLKAVWLAYKAGLADATKEPENEQAPQI